MSWYNEAIFYHIYPLGLTGAPKTNDYGAPVSRLNTLLPWVDHIKEIVQHYTSVLYLRV